MLRKGASLQNYLVRFWYADEDAFLNLGDGRQLDEGYNLL